MNIKAGQWYRTKRGVFDKISPHASGGEYYMNNGDEITAVADTPQELVEVGDLVKVKKYKNPFIIDDFVTKDKEWFWAGEQGDCKTHHLKEVTKIYTPNANGGFDLQWENNENK